MCTIYNEGVFDIIINITLYLKQNISALLSQNYVIAISFYLTIKYDFYPFY